MSAQEGARAPRLLVLNQYYWPGVEATAHLLTELCESLAGEYEVTVVTGRLLGHPRLPRRERRNGVDVIRVRSTAFDRAPFHRRAMNYLTYSVGALRRSLIAPRPDVVLCMTDPPIVGNVGHVVARRFRVPLVVISQDVFPEIAVELNRLQSRTLIGVLGVLTRHYLRRADRVVAIGERMRERLIAKGLDPDRVTVVPNWVDTTAIVPQARDNDWARRKRLEARFVVMHSGNVGHAQDLETLIRASTLVADVPDLAVVLVGFGARHAYYVKLSRMLGAQVEFLDYQPREVLSQSLSSADVHYVGLAAGLAGYVVPSRVYGIMAAGRPMLVSADQDSETAHLVREARCGIVLPPGRPELVAEALRAAAAGEHDLEEMGRRGREWVEREADRTIAVERYRRLLAELLPG